MAKKSQDYIVYLRANNADLKKKLDDTRNRLRSHTSMIGKMGKQALASMGLFFGIGTVVRGIGTSINKIAEFEYQMDKVAAVSNATNAELKILQDNALKLGAKSKFTATEIGKLQEELARLGFTTSQIVSMTDASRKLAQVADTELGPAAKVVGQIINAFGFEATEAGRVANVMAESFSKSALNLEEFSVGMSYAAASGKSAGFSLEQVTAMLGKLVDSGIQGSKAGTALRDIFADLSIKGMTLDDALGQIRKSTDKNKTAFDLFGKVSMNAAVILAEQEEGVKRLTSALSDQNKELNTMVGVMEDNLITDWALFNSAIDGTIQKAGKLNTFMRFMTQMGTNVLGFLNWYEEPVKGFEELQVSIEEAEDELKKYAATSNTYNLIAESIKSMKDEQAKLNMNVSSSVPSLAEFTGALTLVPPPIKKITEEVRDLKKELSSIAPGKGLDSINLAGLGVKMDLKENPFANYIDEQGEMMRSKVQSEMDQINGILSAGLVDGIAAFTDGLATGGIDQAFKQLFDSIGSGLQSLGTALVAQGIALKAAISLGPAGKIAAGIAAIAAGALIKKASASIQSGYSNASISGGGGGGGGGSVSSGFQSQPIILNGKLSVSTRELRFALANDGAKDTRNR